MSKGNEKTRKTSGILGGKATSPKGEPSTGARRGWRTFVSGVLFTFLLLGLKWTIEETTFGMHLEVMTYNLLQHRLSQMSRDTELPVVVVGIDDLRVGRSKNSSSGRAVTPRENLRQLVAAIAEQSPRAIGIDIDFSPDEHGYITAADPEFFEFCLTLKRKTGIPIFLGVHRSQLLPPAAWLGSPGYQELAASITIPRDSKKMFEWIRVENSATRCPTMSSALANVARDSTARRPVWYHWVIQSISKKQLAPELLVAEFLVDYSPLDALQKEARVTRLLAKRPEEAVGLRFLLEDKLVLLGDATLGVAPDNFVIPDREDPAPGVYLHACATYTLLEAQLYRWTLAGRVVVDLILSFMVFGSVVIICMYYENGKAQVIATHRLQTFFASVVVFVAGVVLVRMTRLIWDDFLLVSAALLLHPSAERAGSRVWRWAKDALPDVWQRLVFQKKKEDD